MVDDFAIKVKNLTKIYKLYDSPTDRLKEALNPFGKKFHKDFYALNDVSFEIKKGETVGIIGRNGAGKSTLLKIITGIITPTAGSVQVRGKISALLELGAGFNPLLTGLENVYFNGTIMGYTREEVDAKIDDILSFADIGDFIHQPVKTYSSGMFSRLAFAVAISADPEILIVDEALAVGDVAFQYKCYQKMWGMREKGSTLLLVTHSTKHIIEQCNRAMLLNKGAVITYGDNVEDIVADYEKLIRNIDNSNKINITEDVNERELSDNDFTALPISEICEKRFGTGRAIIKYITMSSQINSSEDQYNFKSGQTAFINFIIYSREDIENISLGVSLRRKDSADIWGDNNIYAGCPLNLRRGVNRVTYETVINLVSGEYLLLCGLAVFMAGGREELDQRWPVKIINVISHRESIGYVYSPIKVYNNSTC